MIKPKQLLSFLAVLFLLSSCGAKRVPVTLKTQAGDFVVQAELAITPAERQKGLMGRTHLFADEGMLFLFPKSDTLSFWMKDTLIPLDMLFVGTDRLITEIAHDQQPCPADGICVSYQSAKPAHYVLEIPGGEADKMGIRVGDKVEFSSNRLNENRSTFSDQIQDKIKSILPSDTTKEKEDKKPD